MKFLSVCSGIEAASCALDRLGFSAIGYAEIDKAASRLLAHRFAAIPNFGDFTAIDADALPPLIDWLVGGTPCQAFSFAGKRATQAYDLRNAAEGDVAMSLQSGGMGDDRGLCPNAVPHTIAETSPGAWAVRRLTPTECERLQGFPDGWTATPDAKGKPQADGPRYKQLGNSMAVPVIAWIGRRILAAAAAREA